MTPYIKDLIPEEKQALFIEVIRDNITLPQDAVNWAKSLFHDFTVADDKAAAVIAATDSSYFASLKVAIENYGVDYSQVVEELKKTTGLKGKNLFMPLRIAVTGLCNGPELAKVFPLLGKATLLQRVESLI